MSDEWLTERLRARPPRRSDQDGYGDLFLDPGVAEWLRPAPMEPFDDVAIVEMLGEDEVHWAEHGFGPWMLIERESGAMVGRGGLRWTEVEGADVVELPWAIVSARWGRGFAAEAALAAIEWAESLELREVVALIMAGNGRSRRVAEKAGLPLDRATEHAGLPHLVYRLALPRPAGQDRGA